MIGSARCTPTHAPLRAVLWQSRAAAVSSLHMFARKCFLFIALYLKSLKREMRGHVYTDYPGHWVTFPAAAVRSAVRGAVGVAVRGAVRDAVRGALRGVVR